MEWKRSLGKSSSTKLTHAPKMNFCVNCDYDIRCDRPYGRPRYRGFPHPSHPFHCHTRALIMHSLKSPKILTKWWPVSPAPYFPFFSPSLSWLVPMALLYLIATMISQDEKSVILAQGSPITSAMVPCKYIISWSISSLILAVSLCSGSCGQHVFNANWVRAINFISSLNFS